MAYISLEGIDGAGKTTQVALQKDIFQQRGLDFCIYNYSQKDNFWGRLIGRLYKQNGTPEKNILKRSRYLQETLYAFSARSNMKNLDTSKNILSDRSIITAYASHLGIVPDWYIDLVEPNLIPNFSIYIDIPPENGLERISSRNNLYVDEDLSSLIEFREVYKNIIFNERPKRLRNIQFFEIDGTKPVSSVKNEITDIIEKVLKNE